MFKIRVTTYTNNLEIDTQKYSLLYLTCKFRNSLYFELYVYSSYLMCCLILTHPQHLPDSPHPTSGLFRLLLHLELSALETHFLMLWMVPHGFPNNLYFTKTVYAQVSPLRQWIIACGYCRLVYCKTHISLHNLKKHSTYRLYVYIYCSSQDVFTVSIFSAMAG